MNILHKTFLLFAATALLLGGCSKELPEGEPQPVPADEEVAVVLTLSPEALDSPLREAAPAARATRQGSMIVEADDAPATRAIDDAAVDNAWVFQFDGPADDALLVSKSYREGVTPGASFTLKAGVNQRLVVLANSFDKELASALTKASTYAALKRLIHPVERAVEGAVPMSGSVVGNITANAALSVRLVRTYAKVTLRVKLGAGMPTTNWQIQPLDVAPAYWMPEALGDFPAAENLTGDSYAPRTAVTLSTTDFTEFTFYLPTNRRGVVAGTTPFERKTNAPEGSTYIKLSRNSTDPNLIVRTNYFICLGANQTTDYNLRGNTHYTIRATLLATTADDSRSEFYELDITDLQYVGMFGGELVKRNGVWQFTKELWVQKTDAGIGAWDTNATTVETGAQNKVDGKGNTLTLAKLGERYAAAMLCFNKNTGLTAATTTVDDLAYQWYLPAQNQLMAAWVANSSFSSPFTNTSCWSSTEFSSTQSCHTGTRTGSMNYIEKSISTVYIRCVSQL